MTATLSVAAVQPIWTLFVNAVITVTEAGMVGAVLSTPDDDELETSAAAAFELLEELALLATLLEDAEDFTEEALEAALDDADVCTPGVFTVKVRSAEKFPAASPAETPYK